jgi:hypothetical protein
MNLRLANQDGFDDFNHILILVFAIQWCCMNPILNPSFNQLEPSFNRIPVELLAKSRHCFCQMAWSCWTSATRCLTKKRPASRSSKCDIPTNDFRGFQFTVICIVGDYSIIVIHTYSYNIINIYIYQYYGDLFLSHVVLCFCLTPLICWLFNRHSFLLHPTMPAVWSQLSCSDGVLSLPIQGWPGYCEELSSAFNDKLLGSFGRLVDYRQPLITVIICHSHNIS